MFAREDRVNVVSDRRLLRLLILGLSFFALLLSLSMTISVAAPRAQETATPAPAEASPSPGPQIVSELEAGQWVMTNLSLSGAATNPHMVTDTEGELHVVWEDEYAGTVYNHREGASWSDPVTVTVPFSETAPHLVAGIEGRLHAFWNNEETERVAYSSVLAADFTDENAWSAPGVLTESALAFDVVVDAEVEGVVHAVYMRALSTAETPAGVYYRRSADDGFTWSEPVQLYESPYLRGLEPQDANIEITTAGSSGESWVYVVWDVRSQKRLYFSRSSDAGESWESPVEIARPESTSNIILPFNIKVGANGSDVLLVWQVGQPGEACSGRFTWSSDHGNTWAPVERLAELLPGTESCATGNKVLSNSDYLLLFTEVEDQVYLQAWDGRRWSDLRSQSALSGFNNPETLNTVVFRCREPLIGDDDHLLVIGCDQNTSGFNNGDIWLASRPLGTLDEWFPPPSAWSMPVLVGTSEVKFGEPRIMADSDGRFHAFWVPIEDGNTLERNAIFYANWEGEQWLRPIRVLSPPTGIVGWPAVALVRSGRAFVTWSDVEGQIYLSQASVDEAQFAEDWSTPRVLSLTPEGSSAVELVPGGGNVLYLAYTIPANEARGVYLSRSADFGESWSEPVRILDGVAMGWEVVGAPQLTVTEAGRLHFLLERHSLAPEVGTEAEALYYVRCEAAGESCTEPESVTEDSSQGHALVAAEERVHRLWGVEENGQMVLRHQISLDDGASWGRPEVVRGSTMVPIPGSLALALDVAGRLHLLQLANNALLTWVWDGERWADGSQREIEVAAPDIRVLAADISAEGNLMAVYEDEVGTESDAGPVQYGLFAVRRMVEVPEEELASPPAATPTPPITVPVTSPTPMTVTEAVSTTPTPTVAIPLNDGEQRVSIPGTSSTVGQIIVGLLPAALLVIAVLVLGVRALWFRR